jgi:hypothetical protein
VQGNTQKPALKAPIGSGSLTSAEREELARLRLENDKLKAQSNSRVKVRLNPPREPGTNGPKDAGCKGGTLSIVGMGKFPFTAYKEQWKRIIALVPDIEAAIAEDEAKPEDERILTTL